MNLVPVKYFNVGRGAMTVKGVLRPISTAS